MKDHTSEHIVFKTLKPPLLEEYSHENGNQSLYKPFVVEKYGNDTDFSTDCNIFENFKTSSEELNDMETKNLPISLNSTSASETSSEHSPIIITQSSKTLIRNNSTKKPSEFLIIKLYISNKFAMQLEKSWFSSLKEMFEVHIEPSSYAFDKKNITITISGAILNVSKTVQKIGEARSKILFKKSSNPLNHYYCEIYILESKETCNFLKGPNQRPLNKIEKRSDCRIIANPKIYTSKEEAAMVIIGKPINIKKAIYLILCRIQTYNKIKTVNSTKELDDNILKAKSNKKDPITLDDINENKDNKISRFEKKKKRKKKQKNYVNSIEKLQTISNSSIDNNSILFSMDSLRLSNPYQYQTHGNIFQNYFYILDPKIRLQNYHIQPLNTAFSPTFEQVQMTMPKYIIPTINSAIAPKNFQSEYQIKPYMNKDMVGDRLKKFIDITIINFEETDNCGGIKIQASFDQQYASFVIGKKGRNSKRINFKYGVKLKFECYNKKFKYRKFSLCGYFASCLSTLNEINLIIENHKKIIL